MFISCARTICYSNVTCLTRHHLRTKHAHDRNCCCCCCLGCKSPCIHTLMHPVHVPYACQPQCVIQVKLCRGLKVLQARPQRLQQSRNTACCYS
jgi:hypothetical protein